MGKVTLSTSTWRIVAVVGSIVSLCAGVTFERIWTRRGIFAGQVEDVGQVLRGPDRGSYLVVLYFAGPAFGAGNQVIRLHASDGELLDEAVFGEFPLRIVEWSERTINVMVSQRATQESYVASWLDKNKTIGRYSLSYSVHSQ